MENIQGIHLLARTDKLNRLINNRTDRQSGTTTGITIQLRKYDAVEVQPLIKFPRGIHGILTRHGIYHEQGLIRLDSALDSGDLVHHLLIDSQTTGGIHDHDVIAFSPCLADSVHSDLHRILILQFHVYRNTYLFSDYTQLLDSCRTIHVASG